MAESKIWTFEDKPVFNPKNARLFYKIFDVTVDLTNWKTLDTSAIKDGVYPYVVGFKDAKGIVRYAYSPRMKSGGLDCMLTDLHNNYRMVIPYDTQVRLIIPKDHLAKSNSTFGCACRVFVDDLWKKGLIAIPYEVTKEGGVDARLESVLDSIVHQYCQGHVSEPCRRTKDSIFPKSVYHYEKEDALWADQIAREPYEDDRIYSVDIAG